MARTAGATNKPKYILVPLEVLNRIFKAESKVPVDASIITPLLHANDIYLDGEERPEVPENAVETSPSIDCTVHNLKDEDDDE